MAKEAKKGLGTGLSALFGEDLLNDGAEGELLTVPLSKVEPRQAQPRKSFDETALQELADSIERYGLIQPITVRKLDSGYYQIIAGERRWRASRMAGLIEVPVRVISADDRRASELALVENLQREDLNPVEEAKGYKTLIDEYGLTQEEAALSVGKSRPTVANAMRLLSLPDEVLKMVEDKRLSAGHARTLLPLINAAEQLKTALEVEKKALSVRKTEQLVAKKLKEMAETEALPTDDIIKVDYSAEVANGLSQALSRKVGFEQGKKGGKIVLEFYGDDDREALIYNLLRMGRTWEEENR